jgi:hypothetical protein
MTRKPRTEAGKTPAPKRRSGRNLTEAERKANGYGTIKLRLPSETITLIGIMADDAGLSRAEYVHELVEAADREHARKHAQRAPVRTETP